jgi:putative nucleotidyltransferase with HDIG domain
VDTARPRSGDELRGAATLASAVLAFSAHCMMHLQRAAMEQRMAREQELMLSGTVVALVRAIDAKDAHTRGHSERVARLARLLAQAAELGADLAERAYLCGLVHDIGKIGVPEAILAKAGRLDDAERDAIREHPEIGHRILRQIPQLREVLPGVLDHHERWDGTGYPNACSGGTISLLGRVIAIADSVDAMTSSRVYRPACTIDQARLEVARCAGTHFDPDLARAFLAIPVDELESCLQRAPAPDAWDAGTRDAGTLDDSWAGGTAAA